MSQSYIKEFVFYLEELPSRVYRQFMADNLTDLNNLRKATSETTFQVRFRSETS